MPSSMRPVFAATATAPYPAVIFDMDGTLCDVRSIRHYVAKSDAAGSRRDFHAFHSESINCPAHATVADLARQVSAAGIKTVIVTAREAKWGIHTALWLREQGIEYDAMLMRDDGDYRSDADVKRSIAVRLLLEYVPLVAVDDRDDIIDVWREKGIPTLKVHDDGAINRSELPTALTALLQRTAK